jgi:Inner membrane component of T3SS, cytoplasmic domain
MEPVMWLELLSRHHDVTQRQRCTGTEIRIGRAYDNDLVLDDPYVAAHHLRLRRTEEGWLAEDLDSTNGLLAERGKERFDRLKLDDDRIIRIGNTLLRLRSEQYRVAPERVDARRLPLWPVALLLAIGIIGIEVVATWLAEIREPDLSAYLAKISQIAGEVLGWAGIWAILSRVFGGRAWFDRHLLIALTGVFTASAIDEVLKYAGFALSVQPVVSYEYLVRWVIVGLVCFCHLQLIIPRHARRSGTALAGLTVLAIGLQTVLDADNRRNVDPPPFQGQYYPPALRLTTPETDAQFFAEAQRLKARLDANRKDDDR